MTRNEIQAEVTKLNATQRDVLRRTVGAGEIEALAVHKLNTGSKIVIVKMYGITQTITIGQRGMVQSRKVAA
jgi:hypothetical protein